VIVVDTTVLVYFLGGEHPLREPCRRVMTAVRAGRLQATMTADRAFAAVGGLRHVDPGSPEMAALLDR